jgi:hypothetical protein
MGWTAWAVGDICLFHIRDGRLIASFPISASVEFNVTPQLYQSKAMRPTPQATLARGELQPDDLMVFATDALAQRLLAEAESGTPPDWGRYWDLDQAVWRQEIEALRDCNAIVNDDCTLVVLRLPAAARTAPDAGESQPVERSTADETSVQAGAVAGEATPALESTEAALEQSPEPEPAAPVVAEAAPGGSTPDDSPTVPFDSPEDGRERL